MRKALDLIAILAFLALIGLSGLKLWEISAQTADEVTIKREMSGYQPQMPEIQLTPLHTDVSEGAGSAAPWFEEAEAYYNQDIIAMQNEVNADIVGWLTIPNTLIDYPFVIASDNEYYLHRNIHGKQAAAGSLFIDYRNAPDFTD